MPPNAPIKYRRHPKLWLQTHSYPTNIDGGKNTTYLREKVNLPYLIDITPGNDCISPGDSGVELCRLLTLEYRNVKAKIPRPPSTACVTHSDRPEKACSIRKKKHPVSAKLPSKDTSEKVYSQRAMTPLDRWKRQLTVQLPDWYFETSEMFTDKMAKLGSKKKTIAKLHGLRKLLETDGSQNQNSLCLLSGILNRI
eukprot:TRINITY_DN3867_c0_g1_i1.p1 TRINITY_DN3867_c0_g1~~TRINITY_DN3867_c0_g1_i1.p1  ORF type:complete len:196 (+),score=27.74 TRINITY_DN3867_c0_g1_i1:147-734(+)